MAHLYPQADFAAPSSTQDCHRIDFWARGRQVRGQGDDASEPTELGADEGGDGEGKAL